MEKGLDLKIQEMSARIRELREIFPFWIWLKEQA